jgi:hypothetical protein
MTHPVDFPQEFPRWELDDMREFQVWMADGSLRTVRRIGNRSHFLTPGTLAFTDCTHPLQNLWCDESRIVGWRYSGAMAQELPPLPPPPSL